jgi:hypothetical protein
MVGIGLFTTSARAAPWARPCRRTRRGVLGSSCPCLSRTCCRLHQRFPGLTRSRRVPKGVVVLNEVQRHLGIHVAGRVHWIKGPSGSDCLFYLFSPASRTARQLNSVNYHGRLEFFSKLKFQLCQIRNDAREEIRVAEVGDVVRVGAARVGHVSRHRCPAFFLPSPGVTDLPSSLFSYGHCSLIGLNYPRSRPFLPL